MRFKLVIVDTKTSPPMSTLEEAREFDAIHSQSNFEDVLQMFANKKIREMVNDGWVKKVRRNTRG